MIVHLSDCSEALPGEDSKETKDPRGCRARQGNVSKLEGIVEKEKVTLVQGECLDTEIYSAEEDQKVEEEQEQEKRMHAQQKDKCLRNEQEQETLQNKICQFRVEEADGQGQGHECQERKQTDAEQMHIGKEIQHKSMMAQNGSVKIVESQAPQGNEKCRKRKWEKDEE